MKNFLLGLKRMFLVICLIVNIGIFFGYSYWAVFWTEPLQGLSSEEDIAQRAIWFFICLVAHVTVVIKIQDYFDCHKDEDD